MNKEIKEKWIAALRSGNYKQGQQLLRNSNNEYCCLGVLCDLYSKENTDAEWKNVDECYDFVIGTIGSRSLLPRFVVEWADFEGGSLGNLTDSGRSLASHNDRGDTFEQIAEIIDRNY